MEHYVTLFDALFLPQGLALHSSMERHAGRYTLWVLCVDEAAHRALTTLALPNVRPISLESVETPELKRVRPGRTRAEYCWTLTPFAPRFVFDAEPAARRVTYVDADMWLCQDPRPVFAELEGSGKSALITEHAYAADSDYADRAGRYCVQFMPFERDGGEPVRQWWADRCIEWCFARVEDGKFGDQRYLDDWPQRFGDRVHVLQDRALLQAPWNATQFPPEAAVAFHFHGLRLLAAGRVLLTETYRIHKATYDSIYRPYLADLKVAVDRLSALGLPARPQNSTALPVLRARIAARTLVGWWRNLRAPRLARL